MIEFTIIILNEICWRREKILKTCLLHYQKEQCCQSRNNWWMCQKNHFVGCTPHHQSVHRSKRNKERSKEIVYTEWMSKKHIPWKNMNEKKQFLNIEMIWGAYYLYTFLAFYEISTLKYSKYCEWKEGCLPELLHCLWNELLWICQVHHWWTQHHHPVCKIIRTRTRNVINIIQCYSS